MASVATNPPLSMPTAAMQLADQGGIITQPWWRFFYGLYVRNQSNIPYLVGTTLAAAGSIQSNATPLTAEWNEITSVSVGSGVKLNNWGAGFNTVVFNAGASALKVYPFIGGKIDSLAINAAYSLGVGKSQIYYQLSGVTIRSQQLG